MANVQPKAGVGCGEFTNRTNREQTVVNNYYGDEASQPTPKIITPIYPFNETTTTCRTTATADDSDWI